MSRLNLDVKDSVYAEFQAHCRDEGRTVSDVVRQLVIAFNERKRRSRYEAKVMEAEIGLDRDEDYNG